MGPIHFTGDDSTPTLKWNSYTWSNISNMIFLEAPVGVGFSYSNNANDYSTNDTQTANDNYQFLVNWAKAFPEYATNDFWISGESYAGVYVPTLANLVLTGSQKGEFTMNFKGVLVGNGVTPGSPDRSPIQELEFNYGHGMYDDATQDAVVTACTADPNGDACQTAVNNAVSKFQDAPINWYNIIGECASQRPVQASQFGSKVMRERFQNKRKLLMKGGRRVGIIPPCIDAYAALSYLNNGQVQSAIHVNSLTWDICSDNINYNSDVGDVLAIYRRLLSAKMKVLIYNGDVDAMVDYTYSAWWTENMGLTQTRSWQPWEFTDAYGDQSGGWVTDYAEGLTFATVRAAGHMVPQYRPAAGYVMFERFIKGQPL